MTGLLWAPDHGCSNDQVPDGVPDDEAPDRFPHTLPVGIPHAVPNVHADRIPLGPSTFRRKRLHTHKVFLLISLSLSM